MLCQQLDSYRRFGRAPLRLSYGLTRSLEGQILKKEAVGSSETWVWVLTPVMMQIQVFWDVFLLKMAALRSPRNVCVKEINKRARNERAFKASRPTLVQQLRHAYGASYNGTTYLPISTE